MPSNPSPVSILRPWTAALRKGMLVLLLCNLGWGIGMLPARTARAQTEITPSYRAALVEYLTLVGASSTGDQITDSVSRQMLGTLASSGVLITDEVQRLVLDSAREQFYASFSSIEFLTDLYAPIYVEQLTESELKAIVKFYRTPEGKKLQQITPALSVGISTVVQESINQLGVKFQTDVEERLQALSDSMPPVEGESQ